jgi:hypothetical protein
MSGDLATPVKRTALTAEGSATLRLSSARHNRLLLNSIPD